MSRPHDRPRVPSAGPTLLPGIALAVLVTAVAYAAAALPGLRLIGVLSVSLILGVLWRLVAGLPRRTEPGVSLVASRFLRAGIVLLGVRVDLALLVGSGTSILVLDLIAIAVGLLVIVAAGRRLGLPRGTRLSLAVGTAVCGAAAIAAAAPVVEAEEEEVSISISIISVLGAIGAVAYAVGLPLAVIGFERYALITGASLHELAHVLAAGAAQGGAALELATLTKLVRVALLAPVLILLATLLDRRRRRRRGPAESAADGSGDGAGVARFAGPALPPFLIGFLLVAGARSLGLVPPQLVAPLATGSVLLIAASMAAIGLRVDLAAFRATGVRALQAASLGFLAMVATTAVVATLLTL